MEGDLGKLFVGGISWDTNEKRLKEYFGQYGEVVEAVIMRDRVTGRARGFGFVVFATPTDAEKVVVEKHMIDGRAVEAKRAVPREDQNILSRNNNDTQASPGPGRIKKIFIGGLASTVTESDLKKYFDQFGTITDVVVMYDHSTQRSRGFGFITYDSEKAVCSVLYKTFHELNGKMVEVKRAVPKEVTPSPSRSPLVSFDHYGLGRTGTFINNCPQGYNFSSIGGYGRFNPIDGGRSGFSPFGTAGYGMNMNIDQGFSANYGTNPNFGNGHGHFLSPYFGGNLGRYNSSVGYSGGNARQDSLFSSTARNVWSGSFNNHMNATNSAAFLCGGNFGASFRTNATNWSSSLLSSGGNLPGYAGGNQGYSLGRSNYAMGNESHGRNNGTNATMASSFHASSDGLDSPYGDLYRGGSVYAYSTWAAPEIEGSGSLGFGLANAGSDVVSKTNSEGYIGSYGVTNRQANRGVTA